jgi:hypothetical protein
VLDIEQDNIDALQVVAVHGFTQESQPQDTLQKLEEYENALSLKEPSSVAVPLAAVGLFSKICARQYKALQVLFLLISIYYVHE